MKSVLLAAVLFAVAPSAFAQTPLTDLSGRQMTLMDAAGVRTTLHFETGGVLKVASPLGALEGRWQVVDEKLCFAFEGEEPDCWPWDGSMPEGRAIPITDAEGRALVVRLLPASQPKAAED
jgi:hypothetical protein